MPIGPWRDSAPAIGMLAFALACVADPGRESAHAPEWDIVARGFDQPVTVEQIGTSLTLRGIREDGTARGNEVLSAPWNGEEGVVLHLSGRSPIRVIEEGTEGNPEVVAGAIALGGTGDRRYWTVGADHGFEEWVELDSGTLERPVAAWRVVDHDLREVAARGGVHVLDEHGEPIAYVSAPYAVRRDGTRAAARLGVEQGRIVLYVDSPSQPVLVDPLWVATGVLSRSRRFFNPGYGLEQVPDGALIVGGYDGVHLASTERYDEVSETWSASGEMLEGRSGHTTTRLPSGEILVVGGAGGPRSLALSSAELYDPVSGTFSAAGVLALPRAGHTATLLPTGRVLVVGGRGAAGLTAEIYDPATRAWTMTGAPGAARYTHRAAPLASGALVVGGFDPGASETAEVYDAISGTWHFTVPLPAGSGPTSATTLPSGVVLVAGRSPLLYDPGAETWSSASGIDAARTVNHTATLLPSGGVLTAGGTVGARVAEDTAIFTALGSWIRGPFLLRPRTEHAAVVLPSERVLVAGWQLTSELFIDDLVCGNGIRGSAEGCDDGNTNDGDCCSALCRLESNTTVCRASRGECDVAETCTGTTARCPPESVVPEGTPCGGAPSGPCDAQDTCIGFGITARCQANFTWGDTPCRAPSCSAGTAQLASSCTGTSAECPAPVSLSCAPYECDGVSCATRCDDGLPCREGYFCAGGSCVRAGEEGERCAADVQCRSGHCVDGVCCGSACAGQCEACDVSGAEGACVPVRGEPHGGRAACVSDGSACGGACDGRLRDACAYPDTSTECARPVCASGVATAGRSCDGLGTCAVGVNQDCGPYACGGVSCRGTCTSSDECAPSHVCVTGACEPVTADVSPDLDGGSDRLDAGDARDAPSGGLSGGSGCAAHRSGTASWLSLLLAGLLVGRRAGIWSPSPRSRCAGGVSDDRRGSLLRPVTLHPTPRRSRTEPR